jgi:minor extracellular protease Epr
MVPNFTGRNPNMSNILAPSIAPAHITSDPYFYQNWGVKYLGIPDTWSITQGEGETVAVVDTGMPTHTDLVDAISPTQSKNLVKYEALADYRGHSTHVAGIVHATAPAAKIYSVKILDKYGRGSVNSLIAALESILAEPVKPSVICLSLAILSNVPRLREAVRRLHALNIPVVCAAGNFGYGLADTVAYPAKYAETISVAAFTESGDRAGWSSSGEHIDVAAPGANVYSTWLYNGYAKLSGTSQAAPFVAGIICLLLAKHKRQWRESGQNDCRTVEEIRQHLVKYAVDKGIIGKDDSWGYGIVSVKSLLEQ